MKPILIIASVLITAITTQAQKKTDIVNIPDENFKQYLLENKQINSNGDKEITYEEAKNYEAIIDVSDKNIEDLEGIEAFVNIAALDCRTNQLTSLDVSKNIQLEFLNCSENQLTSLNVSKNIALKSLVCETNQLTSLDVGKNMQLESLSCSENQITSLDVSKNTALKDLECGDNQLTSLDVSKNISLEYLRCENNQLMSLNISKNKALKKMSCQDNQLTYANLSNGNNKELLIVYISNNPELKCIQIDKNFNPPSREYDKHSFLIKGWFKDNTAKYRDKCK